MTALRSERKRVGVRQSLWLQRRYMRLAQPLGPTASWQVWTLSSAQSKVTDRVWVGERRDVI